MLQLVTIRGFAKELIAGWDGGNRTNNGELM